MREKAPRDRTTIINRMATPSWVILGILYCSPGQPIPSYEIKKRADSLLSEIDYPSKTLDNVTLFSSVQRMCADGLLAKAGEGMIEMPGPRGRIRFQKRPLFTITELGVEMIGHKRRLEQRLLGLR